MDKRHKISTMKLLQGKEGDELQDTVIGKDFLNRMSLLENSQQLTNWTS